MRRLHTLRPERQTQHPVPIDDSYWVEPGLLLAGEYPGGRHPEMTRQRLEHFVHAGIRTFVDLTEATEQTPYHAHLHDLSCARGVECKHLRYAIRDLSVPEISLLEQILRTLADQKAARRPVYVHCWAGIGRTGTVIGCWLVEQGMSGEQAIARIAELRRAVSDVRQSPETEAQRQCILRWRRAKRQPP